MRASVSFAVPEGLAVEGITLDDRGLTIHASTSSIAAACPVCKHSLRRIHGLYTRTLADLPWSGITVRLLVLVKKFFCDEPDCERRIFAERLENVARVRARSTNRQREALEWIAFALGGEAGARLARELGMLVSPDTLLNRIRGAFCAKSEQVRVLGVDDFGFRKGNNPGTILVDLERHKIVDLMKRHSKEAMARWLRQCPELEVVSRDRSPVCREAINAGALEARQVTDRWHLLHNLTQMLEEFLLGKRPALRNAAAGPEAEKPPEEGQIRDPRGRPDSWQARKEEAARQRHERVVEQWQDIRRLHLAGADVPYISHKLGVSLRTVYRYRDQTEPPVQKPYSTRASVIDPYVFYLLGRWQQGCRSGRRLLREIREQGYTGSERTFIRFTSELRRAEASGNPPSSAPRAKKGSVGGLSPTAKNVADLFMRREEMLSKEQKEYLERLCDADQALDDTRRLTQDFAKMVRDLDGEQLDGWLTEAESSEAEVMSKFAAGLKKDLVAVRAGLTEVWSTGPVEGFINKIKLLKRQGYGRANFDLLRARALAA